MANQLFGVPLVTDELVSGLDLMHEPEVYRKLVGTYPKQTDLVFLKMLGQFEEVKQTSWNWHEENRIIVPVTIVAKSQVVANTTVRITLAAEDHDATGRYSSARKHDVVQFKNGAQGVIINKNTSVNSAHTIDVQRVNSDYDVVAAAVVGDQLGVFSMAFEEGGSGYGETIMPKTTTYNNKVQIFREDASVTSSEQTNKTWVSFTIPQGFANAGETAGFFFAKVLDDTYNRFCIKENIGLLTSDIDDGNVLVSGDTRPVRVSRGFVPHVKRYSELMEYGNKPTMGTFDNMIRLITKNYGEDQNMLMMGQNFGLGLKDFAIDLVQKGSVLYNSSTGQEMSDISLGFTNYKFTTGHQFFCKNMAAFNHPDTTGLAGYKYPDLAILCPMDARQDPQNSEKMIKPLTIRYKKQLGKGAQNTHKVWYTGGSSEAGTDDRLVNEVHLASEKGMQVFGAKRFIYLFKSA